MNLITPVMSEKTFKLLSQFIQDEAGIKMPEVKKTMLQARLQKRLRRLSLSSFDEYCDHVFGDNGSGEIVHMIDVVTTNKTDFFREPAHFEYLINKALPILIDKRSVGLTKPMKVWSAGCSTGEEPYTLSMVLADFTERNPDFKFDILATDISTKVLEKARKAIYAEEKVAPVSLKKKRKYLLRSKDRSAGCVRIVPQLRNKVRFQRLNFMDHDYGIRESFDIIFCRNVIIYFYRETQQELLLKFADLLNPGGYLFMGHSETLNGLDVPFLNVAPTVYKRV